MKNLILFLSAIVLFIGCSNAQLYQNVDSKAFSELIAAGKGIVLDVRTPQEYSRGHIDGSTLISTNDPKFVDKVRLLQKDKPLYIYCLTGSRSRAVANYLSQNGYSKVYNLQRGIIEWNQMGYPISQSNMVAQSTSKVYSKTEFQNIVAKNSLVLVDFHAPWCAPCKKMAPDIEKLKQTYAGKATIKKVDVEVNKELQTAYGVQSIPGLVLFKNGQEIWRHTGGLNYNQLSDIILKNL